MLREYQTILQKNIDSQYKASVDMSTGMGVIKDYSNKEVGFPSAETADGIFLVTKERIAKGIKAGMELSDYDEEYTSVKEDEFVKLVTYQTGEAFGTDQYDKTGLAVGDVVSVGTDGKWKKATATTVKSKYVFTGEVVDGGNTLARIEVIDTPKANAASDD